MEHGGVYYQGVVRVRVRVRIRVRARVRIKVRARMYYQGVRRDRTRP